MNSECPPTGGNLSIYLKSFNVIIQLAHLLQLVYTKLAGTVDLQAQVLSRSTVSNSLQRMYKAVRILLRILARHQNLKVSPCQSEEGSVVEQGQQDFQLNPLPCKSCPRLAFCFQPAPLSCRTLTAQGRHSP